MKKEEFFLQLEPIIDPIPMRKSLDEGFVVLSIETLYFVRERMGEWVILNQWSRKEIKDIQVIEGFIGKEILLRINKDKVVFKKITSDVEEFVSILSNTPIQSSLSEVITVTETGSTEITLDTVTVSEKEEHNYVDSVYSASEDDNTANIPDWLHNSLSEAGVDLEQFNELSRTKEKTVSRLYTPEESKPAQSGSIFTKLFTYAFFIILCSGFFDNC
jgi:hypothetical protein